MTKMVLVSLAMVMLIGVPCLAFDGYQGHEGQIPLCQNNKTGVLRVAPMKDIDPTTNVNYEPYCNTKFFYGTTTPTETLIWINIQGIQGSQGPQGIQGEKGDKGDKGDQGLQGIEGIQGVKGDKGDQGIQGIKGDIGASGPAGAQGPEGQQGPQGQTGPIGMVFRGAWNSSETYNPTDVCTYEGQTWFALLANTDSEPNDTNTNWSLLAAIGAQGPTGLTGPVGSSGPEGPQGLQGIQGEKGDKGDQGLQGIQGIQGVQGIKGDKGDKGDQGIQGLQGPAGSDASCVKLTGDTMTGALIVPQISTSSPGTNLSISAATGTGNGGAINLTGGNAGTSSGGSGGDINITAGWNVPAGGMGWGGLGPSGNVNILAGGGYNTAGGNVIIQSGATSDWALPSNSFSKVTIQGGVVDAIDINNPVNPGGSIEVEGGHNANVGAPYDAIGGNVWLFGGDAHGNYPGGSVNLVGGAGSPGGGVIINTNGTQPACNSSIRGMLWFIQGAINIKDSFEICAKDGSNSYAWRTLW